MATLEALRSKASEKQGALRSALSSAAARPWLFAVQIVVFTRVLFIGVAYVASWLLATSTQGGSRRGLLDLWVHWDAVHFLQVAEFGYTQPGTDPHATAFFPLYPLSIRALSWTGLSPGVAGMLISTVATVVACAYLYRIAEEEFGGGAGRRAALYLVFFPMAVFLVAPYSEAVFLAGAIPAFYYARRERWHMAALPAAVAMGARAAGLFLLLGLVFEFLRGRNFEAHRIANAALAILVGALPLLAYGAFLAQAKGNPLYFFVDQREGWGRELTNPIVSLTNTWDLFGGAAYPTNWNFAWRGEIIAAIVGIAATLWALKLKEWGYAAFMGSFMLTLITSTWYFSIPRMLLSMFPIMLFLAQLTNRQERHEAAILIMAPLAALGVVVFTQGAWFY